MEKHTLFYTIIWSKDAVPTLCTFYFDIESAWEIEASKMFGPLSGLQTEFSFEVQQYIFSDEQIKGNRLVWSFFWLTFKYPYGFLHCGVMC